MRLLLVNSEDVDKWIAQHHYLGYSPPGARLRFWIVNSSDEIMGAMMWGRPTARMLDQECLLELTRMCLIDDTVPNAESQALGKARRWIRKHMPSIKGLLAYASTGARHRGTIYEADGWFPFGKTEGHSWKRKGRCKRRDKDTSPKLRWLRSP